MKLKEAVSRKHTAKIAGFLGIIVFIMLIIPLGVSYAQETKASPPLRTNLFHIGENDRMIPGGTFTVYIDDYTLVKNNRLQPLSLQWYGKSLPIDAIVKNTGTINEPKAEILINIPGWKEKLKDFLKPPFFSGVFLSYRVQLVIPYLDDKNNLVPNPSYIRVKIPDPFWAAVWGIAAMFMASLIGAWLIRKYWRWKKMKVYPIWKFPFCLAYTPAGRYSLSLMQIVIWTYVTIFGLVYVWMMTFTFMEITPQILMLLGIGGGTAVASKLQMVSRLQNIPFQLQVYLKGNREPHISDLITSYDTPNLAKFQMLTFTVITAIIVIVELLHHFKFPNLSDGIVALMGVSSAIYLGSDITKPAKPEDIDFKTIFNDAQAAVDKIAQSGQPVDPKLNPAILQDPAIQKFREAVTAYLL
jgi:hypothetical protein